MALAPQRLEGPLPAAEAQSVAQTLASLVEALEPELAAQVALLQKQSRSWTTLTSAPQLVWVEDVQALLMELVQIPA